MSVNCISTTASIISGQIGILKRYIIYVVTSDAQITVKCVSPCNWSHMSS